MLPYMLKNMVNVEFQRHFLEFLSFYICFVLIVLYIVYRGWQLAMNGPYMLYLDFRHIMLSLRCLNELGRKLGFIGWKIHWSGLQPIKNWFQVTRHGHQFSVYWNSYIYTLKFVNILNNSYNDKESIDSSIKQFIFLKHYIHGYK